MLVAVPASTAFAYATTGCKWGTGSLRIDYRYVNGNFRTAISQAKNNYNASTDVSLSTLDESGPSFTAQNSCDDVHTTRFVGEPVSGDAELRREKRWAHRVVFVDEFERIGQHGELRMPGREVRDEGALTAGVGSGYDDADGDDDTAGPP
ncbi:hypothetical protein [Microbacterium sp. Leaf179]|uniref:hypothetical protein n=1 Tax=Microbacterium sp. Leaf179 TaxID=1736288 RepID=UPI00070184B3|nr:hypothetical protein [Microbacterium sp. Leaf179]KQR89415.1 hypothetical protein ASF96_06795 [Microbacterium sp. Leaf179]